MELVINAPLVYLASPYSHHDPAVMELRYLAAVEAVSYLMKKGFVVFSPIVHCHPIAVIHGLPRSWDYWKTYDETFLRKSDILMIYQYDGWEFSKGIKAEMEIARENPRIKLETLTMEEVLRG